MDRGENISQWPRCYVCGAPSISRDRDAQAHFIKRQSCDAPYCHRVQKTAAACKKHANDLDVKSKIWRAETWQFIEANIRPRRANLMKEVRACLRMPVYRNGYTGDEVWRHSTNMFLEDTLRKLLHDSTK